MPRPDEERSLVYFHDGPREGEVTTPVEFMRAYCSGERHFDVYGLVHLKPGRTPDEWPDLAAYRDPECFVAFWRPDLIADDDEEEDDGDDEVEEWAGDPEAWREGRGG